jgi:hypothetical protein
MAGRYLCLPCCAAQLSRDAGFENCTVHWAACSTQLPLLGLRLQGGRDEMHLYLNSRCEGQPCARLRCNMFATQVRGGARFK